MSRRFPFARPQTIRATPLVLATWIVAGLGPGASVVLPAAQNVPASARELVTASHSKSSGASGILLQDYPIRPGPFTAVKLEDDFWAPRLETNRTMTIPHNLRELEKQGSLSGFAVLAGDKSQKDRGWMWGGASGKPFLGGNEATGHAVAAAYLYSGATDVAVLEGDTVLLGQLDRIWENVVTRKVFLTGGVGLPAAESFGKDYELPVARAYCETCAAIAMVLWNQRMFLAHGDGWILRLYETARKPATQAALTFHSIQPQSARLASLVEEDLGEIKPAGKTFKVTLKANELVTLRVK